MNMPQVCRKAAGRGRIHRKKRKRPDSVRVIGRPFEQPSPEVCSPLTLRSDRRGGNGTNGGVLWHNLVGPAGVEPATLGLEIRCSIRLSYGPVVQYYQ
jgi:hypothetical protein